MRPFQRRALLGPSFGRSGVCRVAAWLGWGGVRDGVRPGSHIFLLPPPPPLAICPPLSLFLMLSLFFFAFEVMVFYSLILWNMKGVIFCLSVCLSVCLSLARSPSLSFPPPPPLSPSFVYVDPFFFTFKVLVFYSLIYET